MMMLTPLQFGRGDFPGEDQPPDPAYTRGCRRPVSISMFNTSSSGDKEDSSSSSSTTTTYIIDALELPSAHLSAMDSAALPLHLEQALNITEAAVLVYDVRDVHSLSLAVSVGEFLLRRLQHGHGHGHGAGRLRREYGLMLVGNKIDEDETGDKKRVISWAEGAKAAAGLSALGSSGGGNGGVCSFVEVSAKTGEGVDGVFPRLGRDVVRLRWRGQQRREREQAEMMGKESMLPPGEKNLKVKKRRVGLWKALTHPFSRQQRETRAY
ncbi:hypothetical protein B0T17DRAFT_49572 [Bombardia bombarda]|uniref:Uncharacterized protein n=1 Tax=Bombardia bombarda TaxID=252184 RepID=A0AA39XKC1_9PEZI|nr:hypothetical protein B0T17DRAFT_49572 [Bombardia bombarda]